MATASGQYRSGVAMARQNPGMDADSRSTGRRIDDHLPVSAMAGAAEHHQPMRYGILQLYSVKAGWGRCYRKQAASSPLFYALLPSPTKLC
ncbi:hypothetical protein GW17_00043315 [Ensete ventricosum]|nr:hypothetical protein GW17_00043315 [Ensete ventricosum]RZS02878.1 hypothetical protein BHM03_00032985 [Ensete ventricosum]